MNIMVRACDNKGKRFMTLCRHSRLNFDQYHQKELNQGLAMIHSTKSFHNRSSSEKEIERRPEGIDSRETREVKQTMKPPQTQQKSAKEYVNDFLTAMFTGQKEAL